MKNISTSVFPLLLLILMVGCQSSKKILSKSDARNEIMTQIANDPAMSKEMVEVLMASNNGKMVMMQNEKMKSMMENKGKMKSMMKDNPEMMKEMMTTMMEMAEGDTTMMAGMCKTMMEKKSMMDMMEKMKTKHKKMKDMD